VHEAHYHFIPYPMDLNSSNLLMVPDPQGRLTPATRLQYDAQLPPGARFQDLPSGTDLVMNDVAAIPDEPYSPPLSSFSYRLFYYYTGTFLLRTSGRARERAGRRRWTGLRRSRT